MIIKVYNPKSKPEIPKVEVPASPALDDEEFVDRDTPICFECGSLMVKVGGIYKCLNCGATKPVPDCDDDD